MAEAEAAATTETWMDGRIAALDDVERDLQKRVTAMNRAQRKIAKRIDTSMEAYDRIEAVKVGFERQLKRVQTERKDSIKARKGL